MQDVISPKRRRPDRRRSLTVKARDRSMACARKLKETAAYCRKVQAVLDTHDYRMSAGRWWW